MSLLSNPLGLMRGVQLKIFLKFFFFFLQMLSFLIEVISDSFCVDRTVPHLSDLFTDSEKERKDPIAERHISNQLRGKRLHRHWKN